MINNNGKNGKGDNIYYVYCHQKKDDGKCFYIGKGMSRRAYSKSYRNRHWNNTVKKHGGFDVVILVNNISEAKAFELEKDFIKQIGLGNLTNMTDGGEGGSGWKHSEESRIKMREGHIGLQFGDKNPMFGKRHNENTLAKMSKSKIGKFGKEHNKTKPINQFSKDGVFIRSWDSAIEVQRELKIDNGSISKCCRDRLPKAGGFIWKYKESVKL